MIDTFLTTHLAALGASSPSTATATATQSDVWLLVAYILLALLCSFLCSIAEAVLLSITPSYIESQKKLRPRRAARLERIKIDKIDQSLAAILTLNTIAHTVGALGAGAKATIVFGSAWFGLFSAIMTLAILFFSEIVPKTIGAVFWAQLVGPTSWFVRGLIFGLYPIVWLSERLTKLIANGEKAHAFSRDEFISMARIGEQSGKLHGDESRIIRNLFHFGSLTVQDIMTPRTVVSALPDTMTIAEAFDHVSESSFSRFPLYRENLDQINGFILKDDILLQHAKQQGDAALNSLARKLPTVLDSLSLYALLEIILEQRQHLAVVIDEYGGTTGIVTLEDLVETLTGMEIMDETDNIEDMRAFARKRWERRTQRTKDT